MLLMKFFRSYYPTAGLKNNPITRTKEEEEILCKGIAETLTTERQLFTSLPAGNQVLNREALPPTDMVLILPVDTVSSLPWSVKSL